MKRFLVRRDIIRPDLDSTRITSTFDGTENCEEQHQDQSHTDSDPTLPNQDDEVNVVFLDLTFNEVIQDEYHENPDATSEELEEVVGKYLQSLETETNVQRPTHVKQNVPTNTIKRKRSQTTFEGTETVELSKIQTPYTPAPKPTFGFHESLDSKLHSGHFNVFAALSLRNYSLQAN